MNAHKEVHMPFGLQPIHLVVIVVVALVIFGPRRLPQLGRWLGRTFSEFRKGARDMTDGFKEETGRQNAVGPDAASPNAAGQRSTQGEAQSPAQPAEPSPYPEAAAGNFCTACGAANPADARYCNKCGIRLPV
jgi:sec-independent protein translocase protein TatA